MEIYKSTKAMNFLTQFWRERITAKRGVVMLYADKYARRGSPQHLKLMAELTGEIQQAAEKHEHKHQHIHMPTDQAMTVDAVPVFDELDEEPR
jgi:hypothetical protein